MAAKTLSRKELYDRVWSTPVDRLAEEFSISNVGLGKICRRFGIPVPPRGYWAKKAAGHRLRQAPLPDATEPWQERITLHGSPRAATDDNAPIEVHPAIVFEQAPEHQIVVADDLEISHPAVLKSARLLRRSKQDASGMIAVPPGALRLQTTRTLHDRGFRLWQTLLTAFEQRGYAVDSGEKATIVKVLDESLELTVYETTKRVEHKVTFTEQKEIDRGYGWRAPKWDEVPSGHLTIAITNISKIRRHWHDGPRVVETQLNKLMVGLVRAALAVKSQREEAERREKERREEERRQQEAARRWQVEKARRDRLHRLVAAWQWAQAVQAFVSQYRAAIGQVGAAGEVATWLDWLDRRAVAIDPVARLRPDRILTLYHPAYSFEVDRILDEGFKDPDSPSWSEKDHPRGVFLTDGQPSGYYTTLIEVRIPERTILPYEWPDEASAARNFYVPAAVVNASRVRDGDQGPSPLATQT